MSSLNHIDCNVQLYLGWTFVNQNAVRVQVVVESNSTTNNRILNDCEVVNQKVCFIIVENCYGGENGVYNYKTIEIHCTSIPEPIYQQNGSRKGNILMKK